MVKMNDLPAVPVEDREVEAVNPAVKRELMNGKTIIVIIPVGCDDIPGPHRVIANDLPGWTIAEKA